MSDAPRQLTELPNSAAQRERIRRIAESGATKRLRHCLTVATEITGDLDTAELQSRLDQIIVRRPALGSMFTGGDSHQLLGGRPLLRRQTATGPDANARWRIAMETADFESLRPFRPGEHPLVRAVLISAEADRHLLVLTFDQLVSDNWSANLVLDDLFGSDQADGGGQAFRRTGPERRDSHAQSGGARRNGEHGLLADPDLYPLIWRERENWIAGPAGRAAIDRRRAHLTDAALNWPVPLGQPDEPPATIVDRFTAIDEEVTATLRSQVRLARGSMLAAAAMALVTGIAASHDRPLGLLSTLTGRESAAEQDVVGWLATYGVIRLPPRTGTIAEFAATLRGEIFDALSDQRVPFELVRKAMPVGEATGPSIALVFLPRGFSGGRQPTQRIGDAIVRRTAVDVCPTGADIDFFLMEEAPPMRSAPRAALTVGVSTWSDVARPEIVSHLLDRWVSTLKALAYLPWGSTPIVSATPADLGWKSK